MTSNSLYNYNSELIDQFLSEEPLPQYPHRMIQFNQNGQTKAVYYAAPQIRRTDSDYFSLHTLINMLFEKHPDWTDADVFRVDQHDQRKNFTRYPFTGRLSEGSQA